MVTLVLGLLVISKTRTLPPDFEHLQQQGLLLLPKPKDIADFRLIDEHGAGFSRADLSGRWSVLFFGFTHCPDICPVTLAILAQAFDKLDADRASRIAVYLVSVDPERDTPARVKDYISRFSARFSGLTGEHAQLAEFASGVGVGFSKMPHHDSPDGYSIDHSGQLIVFNPHGRLHAFIKAPHTSDNIALFLRAMLDDFDN